MAVFKCKMCGGSLEVQEKMSVCECVYCGTKQTLPRLDDERRANLYDRANHFRRNNEFDKAMSMYEQILEEDKEDSEAYWSLVLCTYGVEYVEDPVSHKRLPTVNRTQFVSIYADENYKAALKYADGAQRKIYETEAEQIDGLQKQILSISNQEEPFDVFICYKETDAQGRRTPDSVLANDLYYQLTNEGFKVFFSRITLEDKLGSAYEPYIFAALNSAKVMVVIGTKAEYFNAVWVRNEWSRYLALVKNDTKKVLIPAYKDMDPYDLPQEFSHLQAQDMGKLGFMQDLIRGIKKLTETDKPLQTVAAVNVAGADIGALLKRAFLFMEDGDFERADEFCERVLDMDPENGEAYLGKLMVSLKVCRREDLANVSEKLEQQEYYRKVMRFGKETLKAEVGGYNQQITKRLEEEEKRYVELEKQRRAEQEEQEKKRRAEVEQERVKQEEQEKKRHAEVYREAVVTIENAKKSRLVEQALVQLRQIRDFSDAEVYIQKAETKAAKLRKSEQMKIAMLVIAVGILAGIMFKVNSVHQKAQAEEQAQELIEQGNYRDIYGVFSDVLKPEDAAKETAEIMQQAVLTAVKEGAYDKAKELMNYGYEYFDVSSGKAFIDAAESYIKKAEYDAALTLLEDNSLLESDENAQELLQNISYCRAKEYIAAEDYIAAGLLLDEIVGYLDSAELHDEIENEIIQQYFQSAKQWDIIPFGRYEQDGDTSNGSEEIEWIVLHKNDEEMLLFSKYALEVMPDEYANDINIGYKCWGKSDVRIWMNDTFYKTAFSDKETAFIKPVWNDEEFMTSDVDGQILWINDEGTEDKVFALSYSEVIEFCGVVRNSKASFYLSGNDMDYSDMEYLEGMYTKSLGGNECSYYLRTGAWTNGGYGYTMMTVDDVSYQGVSVYVSNGGEEYAVRPAIWVSVH